MAQPCPMAGAAAIDRNDASTAQRTIGRKFIAKSVSASRGASLKYGAAPKGGADLPAFTARINACPDTNPTCTRAAKLLLQSHAVWRRQNTPCVGEEEKIHN